MAVEEVLAAPRLLHLVAVEMHYRPLVVLEVSAQARLLLGRPLQAAALVLGRVVTLIFRAAMVMVVVALMYRILQLAAAAEIVFGVAAAEVRLNILHPVSLGKPEQQTLALEVEEQQQLTLRQVLLAARVVLV
jgi:hypothetical protein